MEDLLIGLPVLRHLGVGTKTLLEVRSDLLDEADCSGDTTKNCHGRVKRLMIARLNRISTELSNNGEDLTHDKEPEQDLVGIRETKINYYEVRQGEDPFPNPSALWMSIRRKTLTLESLICYRVLPTTVYLMKTNTNYDDWYRKMWTFSEQRSPQDRLQRSILSVLSSRLTQSRPESVLKNYSQELRQFMSRFVETPVSAGIACFNPSAAWACAPLLILKAGPVLVCFTVDLRPINRFTVRQQFPMPSPEHELVKLSRSGYFAVLDLSHGYWQHPLSKTSQECQSFIASDGIYIPTRVLRGTTNAVMYLQATLAALMPDELRPNILWWWDDIHIHSKTVLNHLSAVV